MTDGIIIVIALILFSQAKKEYRKIAFTVLFFYVLSDVLYHYFFLDFRKANNWALYIFYNIINASILLKLDYLKSHNAIKLLIVANIMLNIPMSLYFVTNEQFKYMYNVYYYPALVIAILCLIYMGLISELGNYIKSRSIFIDNSNPFVAFLCRRTNIFKLGHQI